MLAVVAGEAESGPNPVIRVIREDRQAGAPKNRQMSSRINHLFFLPEVREFIKDTRPKTNTTRGGRKAHRPTPKTRTIHPTVLPDR